MVHVRRVRMQNDVSFSSLHAKRCSPKCPVALRVVKWHSKTWSLTCTKASGQIQRKTPNCAKIPQNNIQNLPRQLRVVQRMSIRPLGTHRARSMGSSACSRHPKTSPTKSLSLSLEPTVGAKRRKEKTRGISGFYSLKTPLSGARFGCPKVIRAATVDNQISTSFTFGQSGSDTCPLTRAPSPRTQRRPTGGRHLAPTPLPSASTGQRRVPSRAGPANGGSPPGGSPIFPR